MTSQFFINWFSLHARLDSHCEGWSYKKKKKKMKIIEQSCIERTHEKTRLLTLDLSYLGHRSKESILRAENCRVWPCAQRKCWQSHSYNIKGRRQKDHATYQNNEWTCRKLRKWNQFRQFRWTTTKVIATEKTLAGYILMMSQGFKRRSEWRTNTHNLVRCHHSW